MPQNLQIGLMLQKFQIQKIKNQKIGIAFLLKSLIQKQKNQKIGMMILMENGLLQ